MRFVAFDLESTDGCFANGNICEFGYCISDENFNIIEQKNILIKPLGKVNTAYYRLKLSYPLKVYYNSPSFVENYEKIKKILAMPDTIVLGHAIHNDIVGVNGACKINTLPCFDFQFVDTQLLYSIFKQVSGVMSLDKIAEEMQVEFAHHRADEDAKLSLLTLKYICEQEKMDFNTLIAYYDATIGVNDGGEITNFVSNKCMSQAPSVNSKNSKRRILSMFKPIIPNKNEIDKNSCFYRKKVFINREVSLEDIDLTRAMINKLYAMGGRIVSGVFESDFYVGDIEDIEGYKKQIISLEQFKNMLGELKKEKYDDQAILNEYMKERADKRKAEKIAKINTRNLQNKSLI